MNICSSQDIHMRGGPFASSRWMFFNKAFRFPTFIAPIIQFLQRLKQPWHKEMRKEGMVLLESWTADIPTPLTCLMLPPQHKYLFVLLTLSAQVLPRLKTSHQWSTMLSGKAAGECQHQPPLPSAQGLLSLTCWFLAFLYADKMGKSVSGKLELTKWLQVPTNSSFLNKGSFWKTWQRCLVIAVHRISLCLNIKETVAQMK